MYHSPINTLKIRINDLPQAAANSPALGITKKPRKKSISDVITEIMVMNHGRSTPYNSEKPDAPIAAKADDTASAVTTPLAGLN